MPPTTPRASDEPNGHAARDRDEKLGTTTKGRALVMPWRSSTTNTAGMNVKLSARVATIPTAVNIPKMRNGSMSIATKESNPTAVVSPAVSTTGPVPAMVRRTASGQSATWAWALKRLNM